MCDDAHQGAVVPEPVRKQRGLVLLHEHDFHDAMPLSRREGLQAGTREQRALQGAGRHHPRHARLRGFCFAPPPAFLGQEPTSSKFHRGPVRSVLCHRCAKFGLIAALHNGDILGSSSSAIGLLA